MLCFLGISPSSKLPVPKLVLLPMIDRVWLCSSAGTGHIGLFQVFSAQNNAAALDAFHIGQDYGLTKYLIFYILSRLVGYDIRSSMNFIHG